MSRVWKKAIRKQEFPPPNGKREGMRIRVAGAIVLIILAVVAVSAFLTLGLVEELKVEGFREDNGALVADLVDGLQNRVAGIHIGPSLPEGSPGTLLRVSIPHLEGTQLDSLSIEFESFLQVEIFPPFEVALAAPKGYPWPAIEFHRSEDGRAVAFSVPDLGFQGKGTVNLEFYVTPAIPEPLELNVKFVITMHEEGIVTLRSMKAEAVTTLTLGGEDTSQSCVGQSCKRSP